MKKLIAFLMILCMIVSLCACASDSGDTLTENSIDTPYVEIKVPDDFVGNVTSQVTSADPYTLTFSADDGTEIFSLVFNGDGKDLVLVGTLIGDEENTIVYMDVPSIDPENENYETYAAYQEEMSYVIEHLSDDQEFAANQIIESEHRETYDIETDVVTLKYPAKWKDKVTVDVSGDGVRFYSNDVELFDFLFGEGADGQLIGTYNGTPISIVLHEIDTGFEDEVYQELLAMQEDSNVILDYLEKDGSFSYTK